MKTMLAVVFVLGAVSVTSGAIVGNTTRVRGMRNATYYLYNDQVTAREALQVCQRENQQLASYWWARDAIRRLTQSQNISLIWSSAALINRTGGAVTLHNMNALPAAQQPDYSYCIAINTTRTYGKMGPPFARNASRDDFWGFPKNQSSVSDRYLNHVTTQNNSKPKTSIPVNCGQRLAFVCIKQNPITIPMEQQTTDRPPAQTVNVTGRT